MSGTALAAGVFAPEKSAASALPVTKIRTLIDRTIFNAPVQILPFIGVPKLSTLQFILRAIACGVLATGSLKLADGAEPSAVASSYGRLPGGEEVRQFTLKNSHGMQATVIEYGATLVELQVPDRSGKLTSVVLGANSLDEYAKGFPAASTIGRYANRIRGGKFTLDGVEYKVTKNSGENHIHGGRNNFAKVRWSGVVEAQKDEARVSLKYLSKDGDEGFPGTLDVNVSYTLSDRNELRIDYRVKTDKPTVVNLTNHAYFNLAGSNGDVLDHELMLAAENYTVVDKSLISTGEIAPVAGTPLDFRTPQRIGQRIEQLYDAARGYDHNYIVSGQFGTLRLAARVTEHKSGRVMECWTTEPGVQLYTANGFTGKPFPKHGALCLETQHFPDSPNHPEFPTTVVRPSEAWSSSTLFRFSTIPSTALPKK